MPVDALPCEQVYSLLGQRHGALQMALMECGERHVAQCAGLTALVPQPPPYGRALLQQRRCQPEVALVARHAPAGIEYRRDTVGIRQLMEQGQTLVRKLPGHPGLSLHEGQPARVRQRPGSCGGPLLPGLRHAGRL
jgi:hypothetical protein